MALGAATAFLFFPLPFSLAVAFLLVSVAARQFLSPPPSKKPGVKTGTFEDFDDRPKWGPQHKA